MMKRTLGGRREARHEFHEWARIREASGMIPKGFEEDEKEADVNFDLTKSFDLLMLLPSVLLTILGSLPGLLGELDDSPQRSSIKMGLPLTESYYEPSRRNNSHCQSKAH